MEVGVGEQWSKGLSDTSELVKLTCTHAVAPTSIFLTIVTVHAKGPG